MFNLRVLKENNKRRFDSYNARNSVLIISHITFWDCRVHIFPTTFLEIAVNNCFGPNLSTRPLGDMLSTAVNAAAVRISRSLR